MPTGFDEAFRRVKELVATLGISGRLQVLNTNRCDGGDCLIDALVYDLYALAPDEIKIVEEAAK